MYKLIENVIFYSARSENVQPLIDVSTSRKKYKEVMKYRKNCRSSMESDTIKMAVLAPLFACFVLVPRNKRSASAQIREQNNIVKREGLQTARSRQIRVEIDLITSASCRDAVFTADPESASRETVRASERLRIHASANRSLDYNVRDSTPRRGGRVIPFADRKSKPQTRAKPQR